MEATYTGIQFVESQPLLDAPLVMDDGMDDDEPADSVGVGVVERMVEVDKAIEAELVGIEKEPEVGSGTPVSHDTLRAVPPVTISV